MEPLPNIVRERLKQAASGDHPDADLLTAFAEKALPAQERSRVFAHLSGCVDCREVLALAAPPMVAGPESLDTARPVPWFRWPVLRWGALAACVVVVGSAVLMQREVFQKQSAPAAIRVETTATVLAEQKGREADKDSTLRLQQQVGNSSQVSDDQFNAYFDAEQRLQGKKGDVRRDQRQLKAPAPAAPAVATKAMPEGIGQGYGYAGAAGAGIAGGSLATSPAQAWKSTPAPAAREEAKNLQPQSSQLADSSKVSKSSDAVETGGAAETVEVHTGPPATPLESASVADLPEKQEAPGRAKAPSPALQLAPAAIPAPPPAAQNEMLAKSNAKAAAGLMVAHRAPVSRWTISADGQLQHSTDSGQSWQPVPVAEKATFRALSANGPDLWVGGASGLLYHSSDAGAHWTQVKPTAADATLTADIAAIEFTDPRNGKITTANGELWLTNDAGESWKKQ